MASKGKRARRSTAARQPAASDATASSAQVAAVVTGTAGGPASKRARVLDVAAHVAVPVGFIVLMLAAHPFRTYFEFDPDEGNNVIKSLMLHKGYALYEEIWSDQAPLFTYALKWWFDLFGYTVNAGRIFVLFCSAVALWGIYQILRRTWGHPHALAGVLLLVLSPYYVVVSVSVMLGLPALMLAVLSVLALTVWHSRGGTVWLVLSAVAMSLSMLTKMFTGFLVPILVAAIVLAEWRRRRGTPRPFRRLIPAVLWSAVFTLGGAAILLLLVSPANLSLLIEPHLAARTSEYYVRRAAQADIHFWLYGTGDVLALALIGTLCMLLNRRWMTLVVVAWFGAAYVSLRSHAPVWYHHLPLIMIPASMLGGIALGEMVPRTGLRPRPHGIYYKIGRVVLGVAALVGAVFVVYHLEDKINQSSKYGSMVEHAPRDRYLTAVMKQYADKSKWVYADRQMFAFRADLPIPPELSVTSEKRIHTTDLTQERFVEVIQQYKPEQVVFCGWRMPMTSAMLRYLNEAYFLIYYDEIRDRTGRPGVYIRKGLEDDYVAALEAALKEAPECPQAYDNLGRWAARRGNVAKAIEWYRKAIEKDPGYATGLAHLAETLIANEQFAEGFQVYRQGLEHDARRGRLEPTLLVSYAWRLATCVEPEWRDGELAEQLASQAIKASRGETPQYLNVLAAAYAEQGRFQDAIRTARRAGQLAEKNRQSGVAARVRTALELYQANHAYRERAGIPKFP